MTDAFEGLITAPVSRHLVVADPDRTAAFYRDVLGFSVREAQGEYGAPVVAELVNGPARIQLGTGDGARGHAVLFFETNDVAVMHAAVAARGGKPSEMEKVNWIKMRMFEVRDPDGNALWFGQTYQEPHARRIPRGQLRKTLPEMPLNDVAAGVAHYRDVLGFTINYAQHDIGVMDRDSVTVVLIARTAEHTGIGSFYVYIRDADALHAELTAKGANVLDEPMSMPWGLRQFHVLDLERNRITFGQTFE